MEITPEVLKNSVSDGVREGIKAALADEELVKSFWAKGFEHLTKHASTNASQWIGKRVLVVGITAVFIWSMGWLYRNGAFK